MTPTLIALPLLSIEAVPAPALLHLTDFGRELPVFGYAWLYRGLHTTPVFGAQNARLKPDAQARESRSVSLACASGFCGTANTPDDQPAPDAAWTLIDTGNENPQAANVGRPAARRWQTAPLDAALAQHGVRPEQIADVILTHLHHDHCGSIERFPAARWHAPAVEWAFVNDPHSADLAPAPLYPRDLFPRMAQHGVLPLADGDEPVAGLRVVHLGGHSIGSLAIELFDATGAVRLALGGDVMPLYENLERSIPPGTFWHWGECRRALMRLAAYRVPVLPSHDPRLMQEYPQGVILDAACAPA